MCLSVMLAAKHPHVVRMILPALGKGNDVVSLHAIATLRSTPCSTKLALKTLPQLDQVGKHDVSIHSLGQFPRIFPRNHLVHGQPLRLIPRHDLVNVMPGIPTMLLQVFPLLKAPHAKEALKGLLHGLDDSLALTKDFRIPANAMARDPSVPLPLNPQEIFADGTEVNQALQRKPLRTP